METRPIQKPIDDTQEIIMAGQGAGKCWNFTDINGQKKIQVQLRINERTPYIGGIGGTLEEAVQNAIASAQQDATALLESAAWLKEHMA
jgi:hypothetical protein